MEMVTFVAYDFDGKKVWARNIQKETVHSHFLDFSSSPSCNDGKLFIQVMQRNEPVDGRAARGRPDRFLPAGPESRERRGAWKQIRPAEARQESMEAFSTPIPLRTPAEANSRRRG